MADVNQGQVFGSGGSQAPPDRYNRRDELVGQSNKPSALLRYEQFIEATHRELAGLSEALDTLEHRLRPVSCQLPQTKSAEGRVPDPLPLPQTALENGLSSQLQCVKEHRSRLESLMRDLTL